MAKKDITDWITVNGKHIPLGAGESKADAIKKALDKDADTKEKQINQNEKESKIANLEEKLKDAKGFIAKNNIKNEIEMIKADFKGTLAEWKAQKNAKLKAEREAEAKKLRDKKEADAKAKKDKDESKKNDYRLEHRPGNPIKHPDEVATVDKITNGNYFSKDILTHPRDYFSDYGDYKGTDKMLSILQKAQNNPDMEVTIYRGAPSGGTLNQGDWVTLSEDYAKAYATGGNYSDNKNSKVYSYKVKVKDLSFDGDSIYEFGYWGKKLK